MKKRNWKISRAILPLLLSVVMVAEPVGATMVYAEEGEPAVTQAQEPTDDEGEMLPDKPENTDEDVAGELVQDEKNDEQEKEDDGVDKGEDNASSDDIEKEGENSEDTEDTDHPSDDGETSDTEDGDEQELESGEEKLPEEEEVPGEELPGDEVPQEEKEAEESVEEDLEGFKGMPSSYRLTSEQMENKRSLAQDVSEDGELLDNANYVEGEVVLLVDSEEEAKLIAEAYNAEIKSFEYGVLTLKLDKKDSVQKALKVASDLELNMPAVWPNYRRYLHEETAPEDTVLTSEDGMEIETSEYEVAEVAEDYSSINYAATVKDPLVVDPTESKYQWHHTTIGSTYAWAEGYTGQGIKVAVLDSGVANHNDLGNVTSIYGDSYSIEEPHGTHVAGIIGARLNGSLGAGVAPDVTLYSGNLGGIDSADILKGIRAAVETDVDAINMSIGGPGASKLEQDVVNEAYDAGIAIFASSGNDGGQTYSYPACYDHVISVAATDKNNERASFSNYSNLVDLSAPGVEIWSTDKNNASDYLSMQGTSMACPVATGEAAVLLGSHETLKSMAKNGKKVDALESLMKKNAIKAGSGMGAGITSLTKAFGLSTAAAKPMAPNIQIVPDEAAQKVNVTITAQAGTTIYFTRNGKNPSFKNGEADAKTETELYSSTFMIEDRAKATIKAIAVNESGVASAVKSVTYTMSPYVTDIEISGVQQVAAGKSIQLSATVTPAYATNKKVIWELKNVDGTALSGDLSKKLKILTNGKVTADKTLTAGKYKVVVTAQDDGKKSAEYEIDVISGIRVKSVKFLTEKTGKTVLKNIILELPEKKTYDFSQNLLPEAMSEGTTFTMADFKWTSSNKQIAEVDSAGVVTAKKAGKVTITALANDSSNKKATCTVTVKQLAEGITLSGPASLAVGKSVTFKATVTPQNVTNKKVTWELYKDGKKIDKKVDAAYAKTVGVSISTSGKVSAAKNAQTGQYTVKAVAADGSGKEGTALVEVRSGAIGGFAFADKKDTKVTIFRKSSVSGTPIKKEISVKISQSGAADLTAYTVTNSNKGIATVSELRTDDVIKLTIQATGKATGKTNITIASTDGSNKKLTCVVTVVNPASAIFVSPKSGENGCLVRGKSLSLKASVQAEKGALSNKKVMWELYTTDGRKIDKKLGDELGVSISTSGKVSAKKDAKLTDNGNVSKATYIVRATAQDGSGVSADYTVSVTEGTKGRFVMYTLSNGVRVQPIIMGRTYKGLQVNQEGYVYTFEVGAPDVYQGGFAISSSNPSVMSVMYDAEYVNSGYISMSVHKKGSATITVKAMDGSGKQNKVTFIAN